MLVPILLPEGCGGGHWFPTNVKPKLRMVDTWDSIVVSRHKIARGEATRKVFHADDVRLKLLALIVGHDLNKVKSTCCRDTEEHFDKIRDQQGVSIGEEGVKIFKGLVHSPIKSPVDSRFATKKLKARNMFIGTSLAHRTHDAKCRQLGLTSS
ncbi:hypothetical protein PanWU01x14_266270 [Parasponia andersonii]|uniref:Uncharacterized protein n=1 Tax=Parasponia andersonii TaxID=3476 RepID=A0A2P5B6X1_PARAD|nr:hypothetical protein PanWU01x14_266270 [Parasponia andersonii]